MAPRDFSQDGAAGAGGGGSNAPTPIQEPSSTGTAPPQNMAGSSAPAAAAPAASPMSSPVSGGMAMGMNGPLLSALPADNNSFSLGGAVPDDDADDDTDNAQDDDNDGDGQQTAGAMPTIPGNQSDTPGPYQPGTPPGQKTADAGGDDNANLVDLALASVDSALQYGRAQYGLGGDQGAGQQTAGAMPTIPGSQSNSPGPYQPGTPPPQQTAGAMPMIPGSQSNSPGPYQPGTPMQPRPQQVAGAMPMIPGSQSNSPGPYQPGTPMQPSPQQVAGAIPDDGMGAA